MALKYVILQSEVVTNTSSKLLDYGVLGIMVVLMGLALYLIARYFSGQLKIERDRNDATNTKVIELVEKQINSNNTIATLIEKSFTSVENKIENLKTTLQIK